MPRYMRSHFSLPFPAFDTACLLSVFICLSPTFELAPRTSPRNPSSPGPCHAPPSEIRWSPPSWGGEHPDAAPSPSPEACPSASCSRRTRLLPAFLTQKGRDIEP